MNYQLEYIKVPEGIMLKSRNLGIWKSIIFWYKIKPIYQTGSFLRKGFIDIVQEFYDISKANIYLHLSVLKGLGLIKQDKLYYKLVSYDQLFKRLGYDLKLYKTNRKLRKGNFAIDKVEVEDLDILEDRIDCGEIKLNLRRQEYKLKKVSPGSMSNILESHLKTTGKQQTIVFDGSNIELSKSLLLNVKDRLTISHNQDKIFMVMGLSCKGLCRILGYKSTKSVHDLKKRCSKLGVMFTQQQKVLFKKSCNILDEVLLKYRLRPVSYCFHGSFGNELDYRLHDTFLFNF